MSLWMLDVREAKGEERLDYGAFVGRNPSSYRMERVRPQEWEPVGRIRVGGYQIFQKVYIGKSKSHTIKYGE